MADPQLPAILAANETYATGAGEPMPAPPARALAVVTCMDARIDPLSALGLALGDAHVIRNAGGRVTDDVLRSLAVSSHVLGTREVAVIQHSRCGMEGKTNEALRDATGCDLEFHPFPEVRASAAADADRLRSAGILAEGTVVWGAVYDVDTRRLEVVSEPAVAAG